MSLLAESFKRMQTLVTFYQTSVKKRKASVGLWGPPGANAAVHGGQLPPCTVLGTLQVPAQVSQKSGEDPQPMCRCSLEVQWR